ncbi:cytochrome P450 [Lophiostoma macrostomum CBS 122681]|uniref:Cytochrome P450 n=1 Tax=Lophiostoma macrostomum CBS 122681 TaxID=1314788 RepID=A0A6A6TAE5_9PLEO|nr:cytochrome P450 [Lophiostoma macrostomum CBS 122681]
MLRSLNLTRYGSRDWHLREKAQAHIKYGDTWALVTPGQIWLNVANPEAIVDIFQRRTQFTRPVELYQMLNVFGRNVSTVCWVEWKSHRRIISAPFNELGEQHCMDTRTVSLNVLAATGFSRSYRFSESRASDEHDGVSGYWAALMTLMDNSLFMQLVLRATCSLPFAPALWGKIGEAADNFKDHLASSLLRASEEYSHEKQSISTNSKGLTIDELLGNIYLINIAGHDTTANTLAYSVVNLAMRPDVQNWLSEEIKAVVGDDPSETWNYESTFKHLKRPLAIMYETLRLFPPIMAMPKFTGDQHQSLFINDSIITIPSNVYVVPSLLAVQSHPSYWGEDALEWKPSRWIDADNGFVVPRKGTYLPWSDGAQNCPGKKFSQVTFVAVVASLFRFHRVHPLCADGESDEELKARLHKTVEEISHGVLLRMKDADSVRLSWTLHTDL